MPLPPPRQLFALSCRTAACIGRALIHARPARFCSPRDSERPSKGRARARVGRRGGAGADDAQTPASRGASERLASLRWTTAGRPKRQRRAHRPVIPRLHPAMGRRGDSAPALVPRVAPPEPTAHPATRVGFLPACRYPPLPAGARASHSRSCAERLPRAISASRRESTTLAGSSPRLGAATGRRRMVTDTLPGRQEVVGPCSAV